MSDTNTSKPVSLGNSCRPGTIGAFRDPPHCPRALEPFVRHSSSLFLRVCSRFGPRWLSRRRGSTHSRCGGCDSKSSGTGRHRFGCATLSSLGRGELLLPTRLSRGCARAVAPACTRGGSPTPCVSPLRPALTCSCLGSTDSCRAASPFSPPTRKVPGSPVQSRGGPRGWSIFAIHVLHDRPYGCIAGYINHAEYVDGYSTS